MIDNINQNIIDQLNIVYDLNLVELNIN